MLSPVLTQGMSTVVDGVPGRIITTDHNNPYYWFVVAADCKRPEGLALTKFNLGFTNPVPHTSQDIWYAQFSYDQQGNEPSFLN